MSGLGAAASASTPARPATNYRGQLFAVSAASRSDAWAVGFSGSLKTLTLHWNGSSWVKVPGPSPGGENLLNGVSTLSGSDAWAVGSYSSSAGIRTLVLHWNGIRWSQVPSPSPEVVDGTFLQSVSAVSAADVWAAGWYYLTGGEASNTLMLHWNGTRWSRVHSANPVHLGFNSLNGVSAPSNRAAWAVGGDDNGTLIERQSGSRWVRTAAPNPGAESSFAGVSATSSANAWAVGSSPGGMLAAHWSGSKWTQISSPESGTPAGVSAFGSSAWAVGAYNGTSETLPMIMRCTTAGCTKTASPNPGGSAGSQLTGVSALSRSDAWAVGYTDPAGPSRTVILRWNGTKWRRL
jgi:hypothetical protein